MSVWCAICADPFDATEVTDTDHPLCSDECQDAWARMMQHESDYYSAGDAAPVF